VQNISIQEEQDFRRFFGKRLLLARKAANLSQKGLAYHLRTGQDTISNYERGKVIPNMLTLNHIAEILAVNVNYFFPDEHFITLSVEDQETLTLIPSLSPAAYQFSLAFVQAMFQNKLGKHSTKMNIDPVGSLERLINGNGYSFEAKDKQISILLGLNILLLEGLHPETMPFKNRTLLQRILDENDLFASIVSELADSR
jgi:transcriptional regulator with XRE-family HTH domain